jgi:S-(hydroxymethyl)glutathione dehydrogenase / alcohol dehydrogenase
MKAVVCTGLNQISVEDVVLDPPKAGEVKVKMTATGVCHSDLSATNGTIPMAPPLVLGHEGAGTVVEVGAGVTNVAPGDSVILTFVPNCGKCFHCVRGEPYLCRAVPPTGRQIDGTSRLHWNGKDLGAFTALGCMAEEAVVPSISVVKVDPSVPARVAALIGCGVTTGVGAAIKTARVKPGSTVAVFGCGGVGLSCIQGARIAGAERIIGVDLADNKLEMAQKFGATDVVNGGQGDPIQKIRQMTGGFGVDYAFEAIGVAAVMEQAYQATRRGGKTIIVGVGKFTEQVKFNALLLSLESKTICGCNYGSVNAQEDFPKLLNLYARGKLDLEGMVTNTYTIDRALDAFKDLENGVNARGVIVY